MRLFGRESSAKKKAENAVHEFLEKYSDVVDFFVQTFKARGINEEPARAILSSAVECILPPFSRRLPRDRVMAALPVSLCILRKMEFKALGLVRGDTLNELETFIREICGATATTIEGFDCLSLKISGADYPFFLMATDRMTDIEKVPESIIIIGDQSLEKRSGFDKYTMVVREDSV